jgi:hypothetical protein
VVHTHKSVPCRDNHKASWFNNLRVPPARYPALVTPSVATKFIAWNTRLYNPSALGVLEHPQLLLKEEVMKLEKHGTRVLHSLLYILLYLQKHPCEDCGEIDIRTLEFDHRGEKSFTIGDAIWGGISLDLLAAEIDKCAVRCANCHRCRHGAGTYRELVPDDILRVLASRPVMDPYAPVKTRKGNVRLSRYRKSWTNRKSRVDIELLKH